MASAGALPEFDQGRLWDQVRSSPERLALLPTVTDTELRILAGVASGRSYLEIAPRLGLKPKTIKNKGLVLLRKMSPQRRRIEAAAQLVQVALPYLSDSEVARIHDVLADDKLSDTDRAVLKLLAEARTSTEIATAMGVADKTAKNRVSDVIRLLGVPNRTAAAMMWVIAWSNPVTAADRKMTAQ